LSWPTATLHNPDPPNVLSNLKILFITFYLLPHNLATQPQFNMYCCAVCWLSAGFLFLNSLQLSSHFNLQLFRFHETLFKVRLWTFISTYHFP
jgi:hypothetical protein